MKINLPSLPGVYIYKNISGEIIYIGKAINLKKRVSQYFDKTEKLGPKTQELVKNINKIEYKIVSSEIEALVLESSLIKKHNPKYNSQLKDNKSYLYITINKNYIETTRRTGDFGPFPNAGQVKYLLKILRRNFPFYTKATHKKTCLYCHIGLCPKDEKENKKNINIIKKILSSKSKRLFHDLQSKISKLVKSEKYEEAITFRDSLKSLEYITTGWKNILSLSSNIQLSSDLAIQSTSELESILNIPQINRIECYDVSQLGQKYFVGAMSVFQNGIIDKNEYRKFKIRYQNTQNDFAMLKEIVYRRLKHQDWPYPELIVLDGGKPQLSTVLPIIPKKIKTIGLVKEIEKIITQNFQEITLPKSSLSLQLIQQLRDEAHRFANKYRKELQKKSKIS